MLSFRQLDDLPQQITDLLAQTEQSIINDMARRIKSLNAVTQATNWQMLRLQMMGAAQENIIRELSRALNITEKKLLELFDEAATRTLNSDNKLYEAAGYDPIPLKDNIALQRLLKAGYDKTRGTYFNLTSTTARTATRQFEKVLDLAYQEIVSGAFTYQQAIKKGITDLTRNGIECIRYPSGHVDYLDVAFRRATLTGVNQTCGNLQLANMWEIGAGKGGLLETTAHPGARPSHAVWQGKVFSIYKYSDNAPYPNFYEATGYGTGAGLCGWNCRHSFFPYFEELSESAYPAEKLREYNNKTVTYNGQRMSLYDATQKQRYIERKIRRWKREASALEAGGLDPMPANIKIRNWQAVQRDFIKQTGLERDYFRERAGKQFVSGTTNAPAQNSSVDPQTGFKYISGTHTRNEDLAKTNPNYGTGKDEWTLNCQRCVSAYEARRRGLDVTAKPRILNNTDKLPYMYDANGWPTVYKGGQSNLVDVGATRTKTVQKNIETEMTAWGDGARAIVRVQWQKKYGGGGHVFIAEQENGVTKYIDPQSNSLDVSSYFSMCKPKETRVMRVDNVEFTDKIKECCTDI